MLSAFLLRRIPVMANKFGRLNLKFGTTALFGLEVGYAPREALELTE